MDVLLVGLDAASRSNLEPLFEEGHLPTLHSLFRDGASGDLTSQVPPWTASAWPSLYTGTNPGKHGVFGFLSFEGYDWQVVNASHVREPTLWEVLDEHGMSSVVVNAPVTWPPPTVDGAVVPGYTAPEEPACHPEGLLDDLREAIGEYRVYAETESDDRVSDADQVAEFVALSRMRGEAFRHLADRFDPDFGFVQFQHTDTVFHEQPDSPEAVRSVYGAVDDEIGSILDATDPGAVVVVSDHGIGECDVQFRINELLRDEGFVRGTSDGTGMPTWATVRDRTLREGAYRRDADRSWLEAAMNVAASAGVTTQRVGRLLERTGIAGLVEAYAPTGAIRAASEQVDFPASRAYARSRVECGVRINLRGREPDGVVPPEEYDAVRAELVSLLEGVVGPDGEPVFEDVAPAEEYFSGPEADRAVDVVTVPREFRPYVTTWLLGDRFADAGGHWDHKREGVIAAAAPSIDATADLSGAHLFDVAPTVLSLLDVPRGTRMDGRVLEIADDAGRREYDRVGAESVATDDATVEERLADLGYIE